MIIENSGPRGGVVRVKGLGCVRGWGPGRGSYQKGGVTQRQISGQHKPCGRSGVLEVGQGSRKICRPSCPVGNHFSKLDAHPISVVVILLATSMLKTAYPDKMYLMIQTFSFIINILRYLVVHRVF